MTFFLTCCLLYSEVNYFLNPGFTFKFVPDTDYEGKLSINVDLTVAMPCDCKSANLRAALLTNVEVLMVLFLIPPDLRTNGLSPLLLVLAGEENKAFELDFLFSNTMEMVLQRSYNKELIKFAFSCCNIEQIPPDISGLLSNWRQAWDSALKPLISYLLFVSPSQ